MTCKWFYDAQHSHHINHSEKQHSHIPIVPTPQPSKGKLPMIHFTIHSTVLISGLVLRRYKSELDPTSLTSVLYRYQDLMEELLSPTVVVPEYEQAALNRFRSIYGQSSFACRHSLCETSIDRFLTTDERGRHEQSHFKRWRCDDSKCPFFVKGLTSPQALKTHNQKYHSKAAPIVSGTSQAVSGVDHTNMGNQRNTIPAEEKSQARTYCSGTLPSGTAWGCGASFPNAAMLRGHWLLPEGLKCKNALREGLFLPSSDTLAGNGTAQATTDYNISKSTSEATTSAVTPEDGNSTRFTNTGNDVGWNPTRIYDSRNASPQPGLKQREQQQHMLKMRRLNVGEPLHNAAQTQSGTQQSTLPPNLQNPSMQQQLPQQHVLAQQAQQAQAHQAQQAKLNLALADYKAQTRNYQRYQAHLQEQEDQGRLLFPENQNEGQNGSSSIPLLVDNVIQESPVNQGEFGNAIPRFEKTLSDIYSDELYNPDTPVSVPSSQTQGTQPVLPSPYAGVFVERLQAANNWRSSSPSPWQAVPQSASPFRQGFDPSASQYLNEGQIAPQPGSTAQIRKQQKDETDAYELLRARHRQFRASSLAGPSTVPPQEMMAGLRDASV